jgi:uncharacterized protein
MQCPIDQTTLAISERQGIEIDYCPKCRGVWLDRGELDKLIEAGSPPATPPSEYRPEPRREEPRYRDDDYKHHKKYKKESFLKDLFDF